MKYCKDCKYFIKSYQTCSHPNIPRNMVTGERQTWEALHCRNRPMSGCGENAQWFEAEVDLDEHVASLFPRVGVSS
jgi:hypothetical protein